MTPTRRPSALTTLLLGASALVLLTGAGRLTDSAKPTGLTGMWAVDEEHGEANQKIQLPLTPEGQAIRDAARKKIDAGDVIGDNGKKCGPSGMPSMMVNEFAIEFLETPDRVTIINEAATLVRSVYLDEKTHTPDLEPSYNGHSIGHWDGDILVIDTVNFNDKTGVFGFVGTHSSTTHLVERYHVEKGGDAMVGELTFEDPRYLTKPWTGRVTYHRLPAHSELWEYACETSGGWIERFQGDPAAAALAR